MNSEIIVDLNSIIEAQKKNIPQLWKSKKWALQFFIFIKRLIGTNPPPDIIEIHPPFNDYCFTFEQFIDIYEVFHDKVSKEYPDTIIFLENRSGTRYTGGKFLLSTCNDVLDLCDIIKQKNVNLKIVLDYPQLFSAEKISMDDIKLDKIIEFNSDLKQFKNIIGGFHMWGKRKSVKRRWVAHIGDFNTFFSNNLALKHTFLKSIHDTFNDDLSRYFIPEVNSREEDVHSIVLDLEKEGFFFESNFD
jgi:hypothetical protein